MIPSVFNRDVAHAIAEAVAQAATDSGVARRDRSASPQAEAELYPYDVWRPFRWRRQTSSGPACSRPSPRRSRRICLRPIERSGICMASSRDEIRRVLGGRAESVSKRFAGSDQGLRAAYVDKGSELSFQLELYSELPGEWQIEAEGVGRASRPSTRGRSAPPRLRFPRSGLPKPRSKRIAQAPANSQKQR